jgi:hypothetical protein
MARFSHPSSICFDSQDMLYVADTSNHVIRKITVLEIVRVVPVSVSQMGQEEKPSFISQIVSTSTINRFYAENHAIRKIFVNGTVVTVTGSQGPGLSMTHYTLRNSSVRNHCRSRFQFVGR